MTLTEIYARYHITLQDWDGASTVPLEHVWWDGNDINEWGYDDGKEYAYRNTANNRKSLATVTYDANRNIIPLSQRFNPRKSSVSFSIETKEVAECISELCTLDKEGKPAKSAYLRNTGWGKDLLVEWIGKNKKGVNKHGALHVFERRKSQGLSPAEAAFVLVCGLKAAQSRKPIPSHGNKLAFIRFGIKAAVANNTPEYPLLSAFLITDKYERKRAGAEEGPQTRPQLYAHLELSRLQEVGAAPSSAVSRFDTIVKQNPSHWEKV